MDRQRVVRTLESLVCLAFDQAGKPEGNNAYSKSIAWVAKHGVRASELSPLCVLHANALHLVFVPEAGGSQYTWSPPFGSPDWQPKWKKPDPPKGRVWKPGAPYADAGHCSHCGRAFVRGKDHSGMRARYCCPDCFGASRREKARVRMWANRQRARNGP